MNEEKIMVFLSRPNPFIDNQILFLDKLQEKFSGIINTSYTSEMETDLDEIAEGHMA